MIPERDNVAHAMLNTSCRHGVITPHELRQIAGDLPSIDRAKSSVEKPVKMADANFCPDVPGIRPS